MEKQFIETNEQGLPRGGFDKALSEAALALSRAYCKADLGNQENLVDLLIERTGEAFATVIGWSEESTREVQIKLINSAELASSDENPNNLLNSATLKF